MNTCSELQADLATFHLFCGLLAKTFNLEADRIKHVRLYESVFMHIH